VLLLLSNNSFIYSICKSTLSLLSSLEIGGNMDSKKQNSSNGWDLNNIHISNDMNIYEEVLFEDEDGESFNQSLKNQKQAKDFSLDFQSDEVSSFLHLNKPRRRYRVKSAKDLKRNGFVRIGSSKSNS